MGSCYMIVLKSSMKVGFILLVFTVACDAVMRDDSLDQCIKDTLEMLKLNMTTGIPSLGIPPLDPFYVHHLDIPPLEEGIMVASGSVDNLTVSNLTSFQSQMVHLNEENLSLHLELFIPQLKAEGTLGLNGSVLDIFPIYGADEPIYLDISGVGLHVEGNAVLNENWFYFLKSLNISCKITEMDVHIDNLLGGGSYGETIIKFLDRVGMYVWSQVEDLLLPLLEKFLLQILNEALNNFPVVQ